MRACTRKQHGLPDTLVVEDIPSPTPKAGEVVVTVKAAGVNFHDTLIIQNLYQNKPPLPFSPGADVSGIVKEVGPGVQGFKPGDPVIGLLRWGGYREEVVVPAEHVALLPPGIDFIVAAGFGLPYTASYHALKNRARLQPGETLLVLGAAGGIGAASVELGKLMGARVIAVDATDKLDVCRRFGADEVISYQTDDLRESIRRLTDGRGVDVVSDPIGGKSTETALRGLGWQGRYLVIGFVSGEIPKIPVNLTLVKGCSIVGVSRGQFMEREPEQAQINVKELVAWLAAGKLKPVVTKTYPLEHANEALNDMMNRKITGKVVLVV